jgi:hypothetical protein
MSAVDILKATEALTLFDQPASAEEAPLPAVIFHERERQQRVVGEARPCAHCAMNRYRWRRRPADLPQWRTESDIITLPAVVLITKVDGSALELCAQHAREHDERGNRDG